MSERARRFFKMTGSGNDFIFVDARDSAVPDLEVPPRIADLCARGTGVGADGIVFFDRDDEAAFSIRYYNSDGSRASLCGNASLCATRLAVELAAAPAEGFAFRTDAGVLSARLRDGTPEIDLAPVTDVRASIDEIELGVGERRLGFAVVGVPHLVVLCDDVERVNVEGRGSALRHHASLQAGANVNFVSKTADGGWRLRTFERGVEGETLACGTGAVATAILLITWGAAESPVALETRSGRSLTVSADRVLANQGGRWNARLLGEGRLVFVGELREL